MKTIPMTIRREYYYDCFDSLFSAICAQLQRDYSMFYFDTWLFDFDTDTRLVSQGIIMSEDDKRFEKLEEFHGIVGDIIYSDTNITADKLVDRIKTHIAESTPVIVQCDVFHCPWMVNEYHRNHISHNIVLHGYDEEERVFAVHDRMALSSGATFSEAQLKIAIEGMYDFRFEDRPESFPFSFEELICCAMSMVGDSDGFRLGRTINALADAIENMDYEAEMTEVISPSSSELSQKISSLAKSRHKLSFAYDFIRRAYKKEALSAVVDLFQQAGADWFAAFGLLLKTHYQKDQKRLQAKAAARLRRAANTEEKIYKTLQQIMEHKAAETIPKPEASDSELSSASFSFLKLDEYFNNNGAFMTISGDCSASLDDMNQYYLPCGEEWQNGELVLGDVRFSVKAMNEDNPDNIRCLGQTVSCSADGDFKHLYILGCCEFGIYNEIINIVYDDDSVQSVPVKFTNWVYTPRFPFEQPVIGQCISRRTDGAHALAYPVSLFASRYDIEPHESAIKEIRLPDSINVHIFAMTLER